MSWFDHHFLQALFFEKKIETLHITRSFHDRANELVTEVDDLNSRLTMVGKLSNLALQLYGLYIKVGHARDIKDVENGSKIGYNVKLKRWFPHKSFEGGADTIGYGHKIKSNEDYKSGLTDIQVTTLLKQDLKTAKDIVHKEIGNIKLTNTQEEMFIDFVFNLGSLKKFPKFKTAVLNNDLVTMNQEYERYSNGKKLKGRNSAFFARFLKM